MSTSNRKSERLQKKRSAPVQDPQFPGMSKESGRIEIDDVSLLLTIKPIVVTLLDYIKEVEDHTDPEEMQLEDYGVGPMTFERRKYTQLRDIYLKMVHEDMSQYLRLYREKVETDGEVQVTKN